MYIIHQGNSVPYSISAAKFGSGMKTMYVSRNSFKIFRDDFTQWTRCSMWLWLAHRRLLSTILFQHLPRDARAKGVSATAHFENWVFGFEKIDSWLLGRRAKAGGVVSHYLINHSSFLKLRILWTGHMWSKLMHGQPPGICKLIRTCNPHRIIR